MANVNWNLYGFLVVLVLICVRVDGKSGEGGDEPSPEPPAITTAPEPPSPPGPPPKCSLEGQLCGRIKLGRGIGSLSAYITAGFWVDCCVEEFDCNTKFNLGGSDGGICKKKGKDSIDCVGHHMPCGTVNGVTLSCCDHLDLKCDKMGEYKIEPINLSVGYCKKPEESQACMAIGLPCGKVGASFDLKCCDNVPCDANFLQVSTAKLNIALGFCKPSSARAADKDDKFEGAGATEAPKGGPPSGGVEVKPGQIGIIIFSLAWFFT